MKKREERRMDSVFLVTCINSCAECGETTIVVGVFTSREKAEAVEATHHELHQKSPHKFPSLNMVPIDVNQVNHHGLGGN